MQISKASITAIHGLVYLANNGGHAPLDVGEIARNLGIPQGYLAKIFQQVSRARLVYSARGPQGGYQLATEPEKISLLDVVEAIDGRIITGRCQLGPNKSCPQFDRCKIRKKLDKVKEQTRELYKSITLDEFGRQFKE